MNNRTFTIFAGLFCTIDDLLSKWVFNEQNDNSKSHRLKDKQGNEKTLPLEFVASLNLGLYTDYISLNGVANAPKKLKAMLTSKGTAYFKWHIFLNQFQTCITNVASNIIDSKPNGLQGSITYIRTLY